MPDEGNVCTHHPAMGESEQAYLQKNADGMSTTDRVASAL